MRLRSSMFAPGGSVRMAAKAIAQTRGATLASAG